MRTSFRPSRPRHQFWPCRRTSFRPSNMGCFSPPLAHRPHRPPFLTLHFWPRGVHHSGPDTNASQSSTSVTFAREFGPAPYFIPARHRTSFPIARTSFRPSRASFRPRRKSFRPMPYIKQQSTKQAHEPLALSAPETFLSKTPVNLPNHKNACGQIVYCEGKGASLRRMRVHNQPCA